MLHSKELASPKQTALGKDESNSLIVDSLLKTICSSMHHVIAMKHRLFQSKRLLSTAKVKTFNDEVRVQALIDGKKVTTKESSIRRTLRLDDEEGTSCLANDDIFIGLANMGYEKMSNKITFYKAFFSPQWKLSNKFLDLESEVIDIKSSFTERIWKLEDRVDQFEEENRALKEKSFKNTEVDTAIPIEHKEESFKQGRMTTNMDEDDIDEEEPAKVGEVLEVVKAAKLMTKVVTTAQPTTTAAQVPKPSIPRRRRGVIIQDPKEIASSVIVHSRDKSKDKIKGILIEEPKPLKGQAQIDMDEAFARQLEAELNANIPTEIAKKQRTNEEGEELKTHPQIMANDDDDVYTEATPLATKFYVVDYLIHHENNKPYYKIIRADGTHKLFLSFITLLKNSDRDDLKTLWKIVKERLKSTEPKNFSHEFLLNTFKIMFEKPNVEANVWRDQKGRYGLAKVKNWKLFKSCEVHVLTLTTTHMFLLVEKKYP
nr:hypothetical protein [Tanacetum cinerariifolium]